MMTPRYATMQPSRSSVTAELAIWALDSKIDANKRSEDEISVWDEQSDLNKTDRKLIRTRPIKQMFRNHNILKNENPEGYIR